MAKYQEIMQSFASFVEAELKPVPENKAKKALFDWLNENEGKSTDDFGAIKAALGIEQTGLDGPQYILDLIHEWELPFMLEQIDYDWLITKKTA